VSDELEHIVIAAIAALPPTLVAAAALWKTITTHNAVNSRMDEMKILIAKAAVQGERDAVAAQHKQEVSGGKN